MFHCPRCGSQSFRTRKLPDGSVERECLGQTVDRRHTALSKEVVGQRQTRTGSQLIAQAAAGSPVLVHLAAHACTFFWSPEDDARHGVTDTDVVEQG